ncbi:hypothetical protein [Lapillicoccus sp.]|uniref:tetratricopeptide repeat protein n=1 Tax=Lapillicoccus sp. TaxID=1909287 RepID=UPI0025E91BBC|nr:hypothetical protein [Lapillicoccus sp.]
MNRHLWLVTEPSDLSENLPEPTERWWTVSGDRRCRGAFTAAGGVMRIVVPALLAGDAELVQRYDIEVLAAAPELADRVENRRTTLTSQADAATRTRYYPHDRATWIAHGLTDVVLAAASRGGRGHVLVVTEADWLDPTDATWLAELVRRADPDLLRLVVVTSGREVPEPLGGALRASAEQVSATAAWATAAQAGRWLSVGSELTAAVDAGLALDPESAHLLSLRGQLCQDAGDLEGARASLEAATHVDPGLAVAWANLGSVLYDLGDLAGCVTSLKGSLAIVDDADVRDNLAVVSRVLAAG